MLNGIIFHYNYPRHEHLTADVIVERIVNSCSRANEDSSGEHYFSIFYNKEDDLVTLLLSALSAQEPPRSEFLAFIKADSLSDAYNKFCFYD